MDDIKSTIKTIIYDKFKLEVVDDTPVFDFVQDSIEVMEFFFEVEQALDIRFNEEDLLSIKTVKDIFEIAKKS